MKRRAKSPIEDLEFPDFRQFSGFRVRKPYKNGSPIGVVTGVKTERNSGKSGEGRANTKSSDRREEFGGRLRGNTVCDSTLMKTCTETGRKSFRIHDNEP